MRRLACISLVTMTACAGSATDVVSSMNFLQEPISVPCAQTALADEKGFAVATAPGQQGDAARVEALFNTDLPVTGIIRNLPDGTSEVSVFVRLDKDATPLERREADFAVRRADEAIYRACTEDGRTYPNDDKVIIESEQTE